MTCPNCGAPVNPGGAFCGSCGTRLQAQTAPPPPAVPGPTRVLATPIARKNWKPLILIAVIAGLVVGAIIFVFVLRGWLHGKTEMAAAVTQSSQPAQNSEPSPPPPVTSETTPARVTPPPDADTAERQEPARPSEVAAPAPANEPARANSPSPAPQTPPDVAGVPSPSSPPAPPRRPAVQENSGDSPPAPVSPASSVPAASPTTPAAPNNTSTPSAQTSQPAPAPPAVPAKTAYSGPMFGVATWIGKLDKDDTLTITGGTPSLGVLSGAGLPGVPIRITIDQSNLGFAEMPNAANGYQRLVLKSHSKHDRITIHWTVVQ